MRSLSSILVRPFIVFGIFIVASSMTQAIVDAATVVTQQEAGKKVSIDEEWKEWEDDDDDWKSEELPDTNDVIAEKSDRLDENGRIPTADSIKMFEGRIKKNPGDFAAHFVLGILHYRDAKERDVVGSYVLSEKSLLEALKLKPDHAAVRGQLAVTLHAQHRFQEALLEAQKAYKMAPSNTSAYVSIGDANMELGKYAVAKNVFGSVAAKKRSASILARLSRVNELMGDFDPAVGLALEAKTFAESVGESKSRLCWYDFRIGTLYFANGDFENAESAFSESLDRDPEYVPSLVYLIKIQAANKDYKKAIAFAEQALSIQREPPTIAILGDLKALTGKHDEAAKLFDEAELAMAEEAKELEQAHLRERAMFLLDHDRSVELALDLMQRDIEIRQDVLTYDALAWALYKNGKYERALDASQKALSTGARNAETYYHAGMIERALGNQGKANDLFRKSMDISPFFSTSQSPRLISEIAID